MQGVPLFVLTGLWGSLDTIKRDKASCDVLYEGCMTTNDCTRLFGDNCFSFTNTLICTYFIFN